MGRHALHAHTRASLTAAEREKAKEASGSKKAILGRDSFKDFDACSLCLRRAIEPRICTSGHMYCQECVVSNLLEQKRDIKRQTILLERMRAESEQEMADARATARERVLKEFETAQTGLGSKAAEGKTSATGQDKDGNSRGTKRAFELDEDEIDRLTNEAIDEAAKRMAKEMAEVRKSKLTNYWLPSLTPSAKPEAVLDVKLQTLCQASKPPHPLSLKSLTAVKLVTEQADKKSTENAAIICPCCRKSITNNVKSYVLKACGDLLCATCVDTLSRKDKACANCSTPTDKKLPFIEVQREGSYGGVEVEKFGLAFQG
ncbi:uncharacterized protein JCM15063_004350 [Sporobolomyces koalae]|uniref:uncharacterized protein n=1 Tax=Sporobolomyces koalae TaxID=500713 RepID=UPI0031811CEB